MNTAENSEIQSDEEYESEPLVDTDTHTNAKDEHDSHPDCRHSPLYSGASEHVTVGVAMLLVVSFAIRHELTGEALSNLLLLINVLLPAGNLLSKTLRDFRSFFSNLEVPVVYHGYCSFCYPYIPHNVNSCPNKACLKDTSKKGGKWYFIEVPLANQINNFFQRDGFHESLQHRFTRLKKDPMAIEDIYDGRIYRELINKGILSNPNNISLMFNTDGAPVFKSSKLQMWPIYMTITELPPSKRVLKENLILAGLWYGDIKPLMWTFLKRTMLSIK